MPKKKAAKKKAGRPRLEFDLSVVEGAGEIHSSYAELATLLGCSKDTVQDRMNEEGDFATAYKRGEAEGKQSLRRAQHTAAMGGNVVMMIWLGKQWLGQEDKARVQVPEGGLELKVTIEKE